MKQRWGQPLVFKNRPYPIVEFDSPIVNQFFRFQFSTLKARFGY